MLSTLVSLVRLVSTYRTRKVDALLKTGFVLLLLVLAFTGIASASSHEQGDVRIEFENESYSGNIVLYEPDADGQNKIVRSRYVTGGEIRFEDVRYYDDYWLDVAVNETSTQTVRGIQHEADLTRVRYSIAENAYETEKVALGSEEDSREFVALTPENTADFVQNPSLFSFGTMLLTGFLFFGLAGAFTYAGIRLIRLR